MRNIAAHLHATERDWFENPIQAIQLPDGLAFGQTADGAAPVDLGGDVKAFVKPRDQAAPTLMVAREKICADLGHLLALPTSPILVRRPDPDRGWAAHSLLSLVALPAARLWRDGGANHVAALVDPLETLRVFWTWVGDSDHNNHPENLLYELGDRAKVLSIDHSYSLCHGNGANPLGVGVSMGYGCADLPGADGARRRAIESIRSLPPDEIERIVRRLEEILIEEEQDRIITILLTRRNNLPAWFG